MLPGRPTRGANLGDALFGGYTCAACSGASFGATGVALAYPKVFNDDRMSSRVVRWGVPGFEKASILSQANSSQWAQLSMCLGTAQRRIAHSWQ